MKNILFVFLGGGMGSVARYGMGLLLNNSFPYGTLTANLVGCFLIGIFLGLFEKQILDNSLNLLLVIGFCGGFTTFSTFAAENLKMMEKGDLTSFCINLFVSVFLGIVLVFCGFKLAK